MSKTVKSGFMRRGKIPTSKKHTFGEDYRSGSESEWTRSLRLDQCDPIMEPQLPARVGRFHFRAQRHRTN